MRGAGLAGAACALALARQGVACTAVDALAAPAQASSGNPMGLFHGTVNPDDGPHARFNRAAALATQALLRELDLPRQSGLLRLETRLAPEAMAGIPGYVEPLAAEAASARAGTTLAHPAWFYPGGGALDPGAYVRAMLDAGAHAVIGAHPHVTQGLEVYAGKPIVYSLGNFLFELIDYPSNAVGWVLLLEVNKRGVQRWEVQTVHLDVNGLPKPAPPAD